MPPVFDAGDPLDAFTEAPGLHDLAVKQHVHAVLDYQFVEHALAVFRVEQHHRVPGPRPPGAAGQAGPPKPLKHLGADPMHHLQWRRGGGEEAAVCQHARRGRRAAQVRVPLEKERPRPGIRGGDRRRHPGGTATNEDDVIFKAIADH
jgi:hypothetical protein